MKNLAILLCLLCFALCVFPQKSKLTPRKKTIKTTAPKLGGEKEEFEKAKAVADASQRVAALQNFIKNFPASTEIPRAQGLIVSGLAELAEQKITAGDAPAAVELFKRAVAEAPSPIPEELFAKVVLGFPIGLFARNERAAAFDVAKMIEEKSGSDARQILDLAKFYISVEYGTEAIRLAKKAIELAPQDAIGYQVLGVATRLNFQLEDAANAYAKSLELDAESINARLSLADLKRALGKTDEAIALYREILQKDASSAAAQTGLALALFDAGKRDEAETEMTKSLEATPNNPNLLTGAAYWYALRGEHAKAIEYSEKASAIDPRFVWAYIAKARALVAQNKPLEAEKTLLIAKQYNDFPTLDYELAAARAAAGLFREAAESLKKNFTVNKDGLIETYLGNRILADAKSFTELLSLERRAGIAQPLAAESGDAGEKLKALLEFQQKLEAADADENALAAATDEFVKGADNMRLHRQLFAASRLLQKKTAFPKVLELTREAVGSVDSALDVPNPSSAVLADEIYDSRQFAIMRNQIIVVPEIPRQTLSAILRGRIEEIAGWTFYQQNDTAQSIVRLKRALSVLPEQSAWWRSSQWHLGAALAADGKEKEALDAYIKGYNPDLPETGKRIVIEGLYQKLNGSLDGLEARIGARTDSPTIAASETKSSQPNNTDNVRTNEAMPVRIPSVVPRAETQPTPNAESNNQIEEKPEPKASPEASAETKIQPTTENKAETPQPTTDAEPTPQLAETPQVSASPTPEETQKTEDAAATPKTENPSEQPQNDAPQPESSPTPSETPLTQPQPTATPTPEIAPETTPEAAPTPETNPTPEPVKQSETSETEPKTEPKTEPSPSPQIVSISEIKTPTEPATAPKTDEPKAEETKTEETKTDTPANVEPVTDEAKTDELKKEEPKPEVKPPLAAAKKKPSVVITDNLPKNEKTSDPNKPLFETVVISVPKLESAKTESKPPTLDKTEAAEVKLDENVEMTETPRSEKSTAEKKSDEKKPDETKRAESANQAETDLSGESRPRVAVVVSDTINAPREQIKPCKITASQESLSIINDGGTLGVFVGFSKDQTGNLNQIIASSSSPADLEVKRELGIGENAGRAFFIIKSMSTKTGAFTVAFEAPCGKKEILVKVR